MAQVTFDATQVSPESQFAPVPNGEYPVVISESEMLPTKNGSGQYLQLVLDIVDGPYKGRKVSDRLNLVNTNQTAVEIAQRALSQICHAVGVLQLQDTVMLHNKPLIARLVVKQSPGYDDSNEVKEYKKYTPAGYIVPPQASQAPAAPAPTAPATPAVGNKPAWA